MNIEKAIEHLTWKFKNSWKPTENDIKALNGIIKYKEYQQTKNLSENENLAKLWIHQLMLLNETELYSAERSIQVIDEILERDLYEWVKILHSKTNIMRFKTLLNDELYKQSLKERKPLKMREIGSKLINSNKQEFEKALTDEIKIENIIKFVESQITRIINKFEK